MNKNRTNKRTKRFLLLDINDITNVCGSVSRQELFELLKIGDSRLDSWLTNYGILDNKYFVIEDI